MQTSNRNLLAIDVGNSRISCGLFKQGALVETWHHPTNDPRGAARTISVNGEGCTLAISSVVPEASDVLRDQLSTNGCKPYEVSATKSKMIASIYDTMGSDRLANAVAAWKLYGQENSVLVIDFGTATTLTAVTKEGAFAGGFITLGLGQTLSALHTAAAQLPKARLSSKVSNELAFDTESAILSGTFLAQIGLVEYWIRLARKNLKGDVTTVATGGWAETVARHSAYLEFTDPYLTLRGIYLMAEAEAVPKDQC